MIQASELRLKNLVKCKISNDNGIYTVDAIDGINLKIYLSPPRNVWHTEDKLKPIPLTEELFLKFGFKISDIGYYSNNDDRNDIGNIYELNGILIGKKYFDEGFCPVRVGANYYEEEEIYIIGKEFNHVHQLQNIYFSLTGEELQLK